MTVENKIDEKKLINLYHYNPTCEYAVGNGDLNWQPNLLLQKMESELALLPLYFARPTDYILVENKPAEKFSFRISKLDIQCPCFIAKKEVNDYPGETDKIDRLLPWGWSPAEHKLLAPLKSHCSATFRTSPVFNWKPEHRDLYSKKFALQILREVLSEIDAVNVIKPELTARVCTSKTEIEELLKIWGNVMIKAPWSSSGRGLQPITKTPVHPKVWEKINGIITDQGYVMAEPLLNKAFDLAFQFEIKKGKIKYLGLSNFITDKKGQYQGNFLNGLPSDLPFQLTEFIASIPETILPSLINILENSALAKLYEGNFGVDTLIFRDKNQHLKINPCLEINVRQNMGLLSLHLEKLIYNEIKGIYRTYYDSRKSFFEFAREMETQFPLTITNHRIKKGFFPLTDFNENTMFGAYMLID